MYFPNQAITTDQMGGVEKGEHDLQKNGLDGQGGGLKLNKTSQEKSQKFQSQKKYQSQQKFQSQKSKP